MDEKAAANLIIVIVIIFAAIGVHATFFASPTPDNVTTTTTILPRTDTHVNLLCFTGKETIEIDGLLSEVMDEINSVSLHGSCDVGSKWYPVTINASDTEILQCRLENVTSSVAYDSTYTECDEYRYWEQINYFNQSFNSWDRIRIRPVHAYTILELGENCETPILHLRDHNAATYEFNTVSDIRYANQIKANCDMLIEFEYNITESKCVKHKTIPVIRYKSVTEEIEVCD